MRKLFTISLLLLVSVSQVGYYFFYVQQRSVVQDEMKEQLLSQPSENLYQVIILEDNLASITWEEKDKEFYLHDMLYDVASIKKVNGKTRLYCLNDQKEEQLVKNMAKLVMSGNDNTINGKETKHSIKFQLNDFVVHTTDRLSYTAGIPQQEYVYFDASLFSTTQPVHTHPPQA